MVAVCLPVKRPEYYLLQFFFIIYNTSYSTGFKLIEKINATAPQPQRNVLKYFAIFKNIAHSLEPGETTSYSASHQASNYVQRS